MATTIDILEVSWDEARDQGRASYRWNGSDREQEMTLSRPVYDTMKLMLEEQGSPVSFEFISHRTKEPVSA